MTSCYSVLESGRRGVDLQIMEKQGVEYIQTATSTVAGQRISHTESCRYNFLSPHFFREPERPGACFIFKAKNTVLFGHCWGNQLAKIKQSHTSHFGTQAKFPLSLSNMKSSFLTWSHRRLCNWNHAFSFSSIRSNCSWSCLLKIILDLCMERKMLCKRLAGFLQSCFLIDLASLSFHRAPITERKSVIDLGNLSHPRPRASFMLSG